MKEVLTVTEVDEVIDKINGYPNVKILFGDDLRNAIQTFSIIDGKWAPTNMYLVNYMMSHQEDFLLSLEMMLEFYVKTFPSFVNSVDALNRLKSKHKEDFIGLWSELALGYYLYMNDVKIIEMSPKKETSDGEKEICDIKTELGCFEVSAILSDRRASFSEGDIFWGDTNISYVDKELVNKKISKKKRKKILAIDCSLLDEIRLQFLNSYLGLDIDFNVFKHTSKKVLLFIRNTATEQVGSHKIVNLSI